MAPGPPSNLAMKTRLAYLACFGLLAPACIFVADDGEPPTRDDAGDTDGDDGDDDATGDGASDDTGGPDDGSDGASTGSDDGASSDDGPMLECGEQALGDPGFEAGSPSEAWTEASDMFGSPLCDASCTEDEGAGPMAGEWYAWFGGVAEAERASLTQTFAVQGDEASLRMHIAINAASGTGQDTLRAFVDDTEVFALTDADAADYEGYTEIEIDVSEWADGAEHTLSIDAQLAGGGVTSFFVDELSVIACSELASEDETGDDTGEATGGSGDDTGADGTGSDDGESGGESGGDSGGESGDESGGGSSTG